jgi:ribonuclease R
MIEPLPRRDAVLELLASRGRPLTARELAARLGVGEPSYPGFVRFLESLAQEGALRAIDRDRYAIELPAAPRPGRGSSDEWQGELLVTARGFGFVRAEAHSDDLYIPDHAMGGALHGDQVLARAVKRTPLGVEGEIIEVSRRSNHRIAGVLRRRGQSAWLEPDDPRVRGPIVLGPQVAGQEGDAAVVQISRFPELPDENPEGTLVAALGPAGDPVAEVAKILLRDQIEEAHPAEALREAAALGNEVDPAAIEGREDLTGIPLPTIDPEDARDHDDAVWVERAEDGSYTAWIAIADVSHYVRPGTALDAAARDRGCSVYLPDRAIPMLPPALSAGLCSLLPDRTRLCLCVIVRLGPGADLLETRVVRGVMRSRAKLTYGGVAQALGWTTKGPGQRAAVELADGLRVADNLAQILRTKRLRRGALDLQVSEPEVHLDPETGAPLSVERRAEDPGVRRAYQLVEELMLLANEVMARFVVDRGLAAIFRVHGPPDDQKLVRFAALCEELGVPFEPEDAVDPKKLSLFTRKLAKLPRGEALNILLLRAMRQATYDVENIGHFGLASPAYAHFTSPIRRYPDLVIHRIIKAAAEREAAGQMLQQGEEEEKQLALDARLASERERRAMGVEREVIELYRALYMRGHIGETHEGTVTSLVGTGAFVTLDSPFVDVLVRADAMGKDTYELDDEQMKFIGRKSGDTVALGDRVVVTIEDVTTLRRTVYAWRHSPGLADSTPLRHSPFRLEQPPRRDRNGPPTIAPRPWESAKKGGPPRPRLEGRAGDARLRPEGRPGDGVAPARRVEEGRDDRKPADRRPGDRKKGGKKPAGKPGKPGERQGSGKPGERADERRKPGNAGPRAQGKKKFRR